MVSTNDVLHIFQKFWQAVVISMMFVVGFTLLYMAIAARDKHWYPDSNPGWTSMGRWEFGNPANGQLGGVHVGSATVAPTLKDCQAACDKVAGCKAVTLINTLPAAGASVNCMFDNYSSSMDSFERNYNVDTAMRDPPMDPVVFFGISAGVAAGIMIIAAILWIVFKYSRRKFT